MLRRVTLRTKLAALIAVAVLAAIVAGTVGVRDRVTEWRATRQLAAIARADTLAAEFLARAQEEATASSWYLASGDPTARRDLRAGRPRTDLAARSLLAASATRQPVSARRALDREWQALRTARAAIDRRTVGDIPTLDRFQRLGTTAVNLMESFSRAAGGRTGRILERRATLAGLGAALVDEQAGEAVALVRGEISSPARDRAATARAIQQTLSDRTPPKAADAATARSVRELRALFDTGAGSTVPVEQWLATTNRTLSTVRQLGSAVDERALASAISSRADARDRLVGTAAIVGGVIVIALALGLVLARSIRRPLRDLAAAAKSTAARWRDPTADLDAVEPAALRDRTRDEIGTVARAVRDLDFAVGDRLREHGLDGGPDASSLSVDLARRNRPLLDRQRDLITDLTATILDPTQARTLRDVDALAARMHRNTDSILVVAGVDERRGGQARERLLDVVRDAVADVEQFVGVEIVGVPDDIDIADHAADDVEHIIAELLGNAARASDDGSPILVSARRDEDRLEISISDEGVGIALQPLEVLNEILTHPPAPGSGHSRSLGLVAVAQLAARIGAHVSLRSAATVGTTATVMLPSEIVHDRVTSPAGVDDPTDWAETNLADQMWADLPTSSIPVTTASAVPDFFTVDAEGRARRDRITFDEVDAEPPEDELLENRPRETGPAETGPRETEPVEVRLPEFGPAEFGPTNFGPPEFGPPEFGPVEVRIDVEDVEAAPVEAVEEAEAVELMVEEAEAVELELVLSAPSMPDCMQDPPRAVVVAIGASSPSSPTGLAGPTSAANEPRPVRFSPVPTLRDHDLLPAPGHHLRRRRRRPARRSGTPTAVTQTDDATGVAFARVGPPPR